MPKYSGKIHVTNIRVEPGKELEGHVIYTASKDCKLKNAKLKLECCAYYYHKGNQRKRYPIEQAPVLIPLFKRDGITPIQQEEGLEAPNSQRMFVFKENLQQGLLPTTEGRGQYETDGQVLEVSYTLKLSSKQGFIFKTREKDASTDLTVLAALDLNREPFLNQEVNREVVDTVTRFGQGMDLLTTVRVPRLGWKRGETMPVGLDVVRMPAVSDLTVTVFLERTIRHLNKETITDVAKTDSILVTGPRSSFSLTIPTDTPHSGVMWCPTLSIYYRVRVEIKADSETSQPTITPNVDIVIGTRLQQSAAESTQRPSSDQERSGQSQPPPSSAEPQPALASEAGQPSSTASMANASSEPSPQPSHNRTATPLQRSTSSPESLGPEARDAGPDAMDAGPEATDAVGEQPIELDEYNNNSESESTPLLRSEQNVNCIQS